MKISYVIAKALQLLSHIFTFLNTVLSSLNMKKTYAYVCVTPYSIVISAHNILSRVLILFFAAEDEGRTFDPTERKIQKAREEGRVAKTQELPTALVLSVVVTILWVFGRYIVYSLVEIFQYYFGSLYIVRYFSYVDHMVFIGIQISRIIGPVFVAAFFVGIIGTIVQIGWVPSIKPISPNFSRVSFNINKWFQKMVSTQSLYTLGFMFVRLFMVSIIVIFNATISFDNIAASLSQSFISGVSLSANLVVSVFLQSALALLVLSFVDLQFQTYLFREQLKMTRQEIKDELKESEGDAEVKKHIQNRMREFMSRNIKENIKKADVLITNPTHFAVALQYDSATMLAPLVVAKGEDVMVFQMRKLAEDFHVPIIENKPLARALHRELEVGEEIPERYYRAVVLIFEQIYKMKGMGVYE